MGWNEEWEKRIPEDGTLPIVPCKPDLYKNNNIMIIKVPDHMRSPSGPFFQLATIDRSIPGNDFDGNRILDKLIPGLPKVTVFEKPELEDDSPRPPPKKSIPRRKFAKPHQASSSNAGDEGDFSVNSIPDKLYPGVPKDTLLEKPKPKDDTLPPKQHVPRRGLSKNVTHGASYSNAGHKFRPHYYKAPCPERSNRSNYNEIHPWITGNKHFILRGNRHVSTISSFAENAPRNFVSNTVNDNFVPHRENSPLSREYPHDPGSFGDVLPLNYCSGFGDVLPRPKYPKGTGLLGHHPPNFNPCTEKHPSSQEHHHNPSSFGDATRRPPPNYSGAFSDDLPSNYSGAFGDVPPPNYSGAFGDVLPPNYSGAFGDVLPPNYSGAFGDVLPPNYSGAFGDVPPPLKYQSGTGILGHRPPNFNSTTRYFTSRNPNLSDDHPLNNNTYQEVPRFDGMEYRNINPRDMNLNQPYQRKKDFQKKYSRIRGHLHSQ